MEKVNAVSRCQQCSCKLVVTGVEELGNEQSFMRKHPEVHAALGSSTAGGTKLEESFIVLDPSKQPRTGPQGRLEESFLMVPGSASAMRQGASQNLPPPTPGYSLENIDDKFQQLARIFDIASGETRVDQPLCLDCATKVREEVAATIAEVEAECEAYQAGIDRLEKELPLSTSLERLEAELGEAQAGLKSEEEKARKAEEELAQAESELRELRGQAKELDHLEEQYWHAANHLSLSLRAHSRQQTSLQRKVERSEDHLKILQATNVLNSIFHIDSDGPFGTISGFRLGKTSTISVEWEEINAAWGQAVLLLHTMAQSCKLTFSGYRLLPMGSYSRIADKKGPMPLYGPANKYYCTTYDRAMVSYLACLKEFCEFAQGRDRQEGRNPMEPPYPMEGDSVGNQSIRLIFANYNKWTETLLFMLTNLKWALTWMVTVQSGKPHVRQKPSAAGAAAMRSSA